MRRSIRWCVLVGVLSGCSGSDKDTAPYPTPDTGTGTTEDPTTEDSDEPDIPDGTLEEVLPIIDTHCVSCHSGAAPSADLDLQTDFCGTVLDGRLVVPGSTGESLLYRRITSDDQPMPPTGALDVDVIRPIGVWILNGADCG